MRHLFFALLTSTTLLAQPIMLNYHNGEQFLFDVDPETSLDEIMNQAAVFLPDQDHVVIEVSKKSPSKVWNRQMGHQGQPLSHPRDYCAGVTPQEQADIQFIVRTLANKSLIAIAMSKTELEEAGDRIDQVHPLQFLYTIFGDEELKVGIRNIRGKGWVWNQFTAGIKDSLETEYLACNMKEEYICDFCQKLGIKPSLIMPAIEAQNWDELIDLLITNIPRKGDHDRYDC